MGQDLYILTVSGVTTVFFYSNLTKFNKNQTECLWLYKHLRDTEKLPLSETSFFLLLGWFLSCHLQEGWRRGMGLPFSVYLTNLFHPPVKKPAAPLLRSHCGGAPKHICKPQSCSELGSPASVRLLVQALEQTRK